MEPPIYGDELILPPFPRPPSPQQSDPNVSPLVIALIGILASAFLLVSYYTVIAKYCTNWEWFRRRVRGDLANESYHQQAPPVESWALVTRGLEESVIKSIPVCKYKRGDGLVEGTECAVCLGEFQEDDSLRLLPKCTHAFHLPCIDTWLMSHSNCPLCRANIVSPVVNPSVEAVVTDNAEDMESTAESPLENSLEHDSERENPSHEESELGMPFEAPAELPGSHLRALSDSASKDGRNGSLSESRKPFFAVEMQQPIRRSFSVDSSRRLCVSITDLLATHPGLQDEKSKAFPNVGEASSSVQSSTAAAEHQLEIEMSSKVLTKPLAMDKNKSTMRRSFSGGKFFFFKNSRGRNPPILPT